MNRTRMIVLAAAALAAGLVALLARSLLGGGTETSKAAPAPVPRLAMSEVLVAAGALSPGTQLTPAAVRWQEWPKSSVDSSFITQDTAPDIGKAVAGTVVRAPMVSGEPLSTTKIVHGDAAGFLAAMVSPGMRAISIAVTTESDAGGFILPNDRVDVLSTQQVSDSPRRFGTRTILKSVRILAVDQTYEDKDQKTVLARTATLELSPAQSELVERAQASGALSLSLRALGDGNANAAPSKDDSAENGDKDTSMVSIIRYGVAHSTVLGAKE